MKSKDKSSQKSNASGSFFNLFKKQDKYAPSKTGSGNDNSLNAEKNIASSSPAINLGYSEDERINLNFKSSVNLSNNNDRSTVKLAYAANQSQPSSLTEISPKGARNYETLPGKSSTSSAREPESSPFSQSSPVAVQLSAKHVIQSTSTIFNQDSRSSTLEDVGGHGSSHGGLLRTKIFSKLKTSLTPSRPNSNILKGCSGSLHSSQNYLNNANTSNTAVSAPQTGAGYTSANNYAGTSAIAISNSASFAKSTSQDSQGGLLAVNSKPLKMPPISTSAYDASSSLRNTVSGNELSTTQKPFAEANSQFNAGKTGIVSCKTASDIDGGKSQTSSVSHSIYGTPGSSLQYDVDYLSSNASASRKLAVDSAQLQYKPSQSTLQPDVPSSLASKKLNYGQSSSPNGASYSPISLASMSPATPVFRHPLLRTLSSAGTSSTNSNGAHKRSPLSVYITNTNLANSMVSLKASIGSISDSTNNQTAINSLAASPNGYSKSFLYKDQDSSKQQDNNEINNMLTKLHSAVAKAEIKHSSLIAASLQSNSSIALGKPNLAASSTATSPLKSAMSEQSPSAKVAAILNGQSSALFSSARMSQGSLAISIPKASADVGSFVPHVQISGAEHANLSHYSSMLGKSSIGAVNDTIAARPEPYAGIWQLAAEQDPALVGRSDPKYLLFRKELLRVIYDQPSCPLIVSKELSLLVTEEFI